jgi:16S rRNA (guanine966-N2)-methyltransferase
MINIIAGKYKGRRLTYIDSQDVRPTQARVRKSVFDILGPLNGKSVLDLFAGVGSLGIESLSRGASELTAVELNSKVFKILLNNINTICSSDKVKLQRMSVDKFLNMNKQKFDLIFADPPYGKFSFNEIKELASGFIKKDGILCVEMEKTKIKNDDEFRIKHYGNTQVIFCQIN